MGGPDQKPRPLAQPTISAVVLSRNEADLLRDCLPLLTGFDEVVVGDMASSDDTVTLARTHGARVVDVPLAPIAEAVRQQCLEASTSEWVLLVDADERLPAGFADRLRDVVSAAPEVCGWNLRYTNIAFGRRLEHTLSGSSKLAFLRRQACTYPPIARAHVPPDVDGPVADAPDDLEPIEHLSLRSIAQGVEKTLRYAEGYQADLRVLEPWGFLRQAARLLVFSGVWRDGRAGVAVGTMTLFGHWYGAALRAEENNELTGDLPAANRRSLDAAISTQRVTVRGRDAVRGRWRRASRA